MPRGPPNTFWAANAEDLWCRMTASWITPDGTDELRYFMNATMEHIGMLEGGKGSTFSWFFFFGFWGFFLFKFVLFPFFVVVCAREFYPFVVLPFVLFIST